MAEISPAYQPDTKLVEVRDLCKWFPVKRTIMDSIARRPQRYVRAVDNVSLDIREGECLGLVGESGCGKSTLARTIIRLYQPTSGSILLEGTDIARMSSKALRPLRPKMQMIFQDPYSSLNPRMSVRSIISELLLYHKTVPRDKVNDRVLELMQMCGLSADYADRFPGEFSGGQQQRVGIARALALNPKFIIADEPVSALDVSIQAQIVNTFEELQQKLGIAYLFIAHDLLVVQHMSRRIAVMYLGKIVEIGPAADIINHPIHPYSQSLISAIPMPDPETARHKHRIVLQGDVPSPLNMPKGCAFRTRDQGLRGELPEPDRPRQRPPGRLSPDVISTALRMRYNF